MSVADEFSWLMVLSLGAMLALPLILGALVWSGRLLNRLLGRADGLIPTLTMIGGVLGMIFGGSVYIDAAGMVVPGEVVAKEERVRLKDNGEWEHDLSVMVRYLPLGLDEERRPTLRVAPHIYDRLRPGSAVSVRYMPEFPSISRLAEQSTLSFVPWMTVRSIAVAAGALLVIVLALRRRLRRLGLLLVVGWALLLGQSWWESPLGPGPVGSWAAATAQVLQIERVTLSYMSTDRRVIANPQPYDLARLRFTPAGRAEPVEVAYPADIGSVPGLAVGGSVAVTYPESNPRAARLVGATQRALTRDFTETFLLPLALVAVIGGLNLIFMGWRGRRAGQVA